MEKIFIYLHNDMTDLSLIERYMGFYHKFFASSLDPSYSYVLDLYEDDLLFYKDLRRPAYENNIKSLCKTINQLDKDVIERHWLRSCYRPWRSYRSLIRL